MSFGIYCQGEKTGQVRWQQTSVVLSFMKMGRSRGGGGRSQGCARSRSRSLRLAHGPTDLSKCMGSGGWIFTRGSPTCFFGERSFVVLSPSDPGDAAPRPLAPPAPHPRSFIPLCFHFPVSPISPDWTKKPVRKIA